MHQISAHSRSHNAAIKEIVCQFRHQLSSSDSFCRCKSRFSQIKQLIVQRRPERHREPGIVRHGVCAREDVDALLVQSGDVLLNNSPSFVEIDARVAERGGCAGILEAVVEDVHGWSGVLALEHHEVEQCGIQEAVERDMPRAVGLGEDGENVGLQVGGVGGDFLPWA